MTAGSLWDNGQRGLLHGIRHIKAKCVAHTFLMSFFCVFFSDLSEREE